MREGLTHQAAARGRAPGDQCAQTTLSTPPSLLLALPGKQRSVACSQRQTPSTPATARATVRWESACYAAARATLRKLHRPPCSACAYALCRADVSKDHRCRAWRMGSKSRFPDRIIPTASAALGCVPITDAACPGGGAGCLASSLVGIVVRDEPHSRHQDPNSS